MRTWEAQIKITYISTIQVEGEDWSAATRAARHEVESRMTQYAGVVEDNRRSNVEIVRQLGEPWVSVCWYDLHEPGDIIVAEPSYGNRFTKEEVLLLKNRIESLGLKVIDQWNGAGCDTCSYKCTGRVGTDQFSEDELKMLNAPRETKS